MKIIKIMLALVLSLSVLATLSGCGGHEFANYRPIEDVNALEGRKVGVQLAWAADYILSPRDGKDLILYRYDTTADMLMALFYHQIDAICTDILEYSLMERTNGEALRLVEEPVSSDGYVCYVSPKRKDVLDNFNEFIKNYRETEEYDDFFERLLSFDGLKYERPENIHPNGSGEKIKLGFCADYFPYCYTELDGTVSGYDIELMLAFADYFNYELEFTETSFEDMCYSVKTGRFDFGIGTASIAYAPDAEAMGLYVTDTYYELPLHLVELNKGSKPVMDDSMYIVY